MKLEKKPINFEDVRGTIQDIIVGEPREHCTIIFTKAGGVRGNHYHKQSQQSDFLVSGHMKVYGRKNNEGEIVEADFFPGDYVEWEMGEAHAFVAVEDSTFITFVNGPRGGEKFESDVFRLEKPLQEEFAEQNAK